MLTDRQLKLLKPKEHAYRIYDGGSDAGFGVQVSRAGTVSYFIAFGSPRKFHTFGRWPLMSLAEARAEARVRRERIRQGMTPDGQQRNVGSLRELLRGYVEDMKRRNRRTVKEAWRAFERDVLSVLDGERPAAEIGPADIADVLRAVISRGAESYAGQLRGYLHAAFAWGLKSDHDPWRGEHSARFGLSQNPVAAVPSRPGGQRARERVLTWEEIASVWSGEALYPAWALMVKFTLATGGQRPSEVSQAWRSEIDGDLWSLPASRIKNERDHLVPLTPLALELLAERDLMFGDAAPLFPAKFDPTAKRPISPTGLIQALHRAGLDWTAHDLRRTCKTLMGEAGVDKFTRDRVQNHAIGGVSGKHYDRYSYLREKRQALECWEAALRARIPYI